LLRQPFFISPESLPGKRFPLCITIRSSQKERAASDEAAARKRPREDLSPRTPAAEAGNADNEQTLLQEIRSLKEEVKALIDFQKKAIQLLALAVPDLSSNAEAWHSSPDRIA